MNRLRTLAKARSEPIGSRPVLGYLWAALAGLLVPLLVVLMGVVAVLLNTGQLTGPSVRLGSYLHFPLHELIASSKPLGQLWQLVLTSLFVASIFAFAVWRHRRVADHIAREITKSLHRQVLRQSLRRAEAEGAAAQAVEAHELISQHLPELQRGLSMWYRAVPRSLLTFIGCILVAVLVNVLLALFAVVSAVLIRRLFRHLRLNEDAELIRWEVPRARSRMAELVGQAPLLARLHSQGLADQAFESELDAMYRRIEVEDHRQSRLWPVLFLAIAAATAVMIMGLMVNAQYARLTLPSTLIIGLALGGAIVSVGRLLNLKSQLAKSSDASEAIYRYLQRQGDAPASEQLVGLAGLREAIKIHDVTLGDGSGKSILRHLNLDLAPNSLVSLMGTETIATRSLMELLMGFGFPSEGKIEIDGIQLRNVHPQSLATHVMWVAPDGPIYDGTIEENLRGKDKTFINSDIVEALEQVDVYERLSRLPEGLNTVVSNDENDLGTETTYAIGVARALLHKPPIVLALEPPPPAEHLADDRCLSALEKLRDQGSLVITIPRRLQTLRSADRVVLFNGPQMVGEGKHADLLASSDLYRHLNYLLFNPYRYAN